MLVRVLHMPGMLVIHVETHSLFLEHLHRYLLPHSQRGNQSLWVARCDCLQKNQHLSYCPIASVTLTEGYSVSKDQKEKAVIRLLQEIHLDPF